MIKRNWGIVVAIAMCMSLVACGKTNEPEISDSVVAEVSVETEAEAVTEQKNDAGTEQKEDKADNADQKNIETKKPETDKQETEKTDDQSAPQKDADKSEAENTVKEEAQAQAEPQPQVTQVVSQQPAGYGRILFCGDSRTVDMFSESLSEIRNEVHDGITVYCKDECGSTYMVNAVEEYGVDNFDTLVSWMGCNNYGDFSKYGPYYDQLLAQGKKLVLCTVGPTVDEYLSEEFTKKNYTNARQITYNDSLRAWANGKDVKIIDLYSYIYDAMYDSGDIIISPTDGIHYYPQPNNQLWQYIVSNLK
ncbi:hypothetical protein D6855_07765 [Butyrivibrio sp. CB08]|uniref:hypothetical protein n=1 Tax=Butyrivibrio sp. CB08 TaxID=2364879 RepID=UPI000EA98AEB|nr:hypothetical protein [Butyrivibrio sp. CB08]RKM60594.1 hypothetical protein D6855_07765 [Butyrivibrio sp. CB08]